MKRFHLVVAAASIAALSGCYVESGYDARRSEDPHRQWWGEHHPREAYDGDRAEREHRDYCGRSYDRSCEGWR